MSNTSQEYDAVVAECRSLFVKKMSDYGAAWRILRLPSLTDQIFIKASRIRSIQEKGDQKIDEGVEGEFMAMVNYSVMAIVQLEMPPVDDSFDMDANELFGIYDQYVNETRVLMLNKNHDYGEAWRDMRVSSITDLILMKLLRIKQIEENEGKTLISEGLKSNYQDILNYSVFALILFSESKKSEQ